MRKGNIDIEALVSWCYDELTRHELVVADGGSATLYVLMSGLPQGNGTSVRGQRYAAIMPAHPDAAVIDRAVRSLPEVAVDWPASRAALLGDLDGWFDAWVDWERCRRHRDGRDVVLAEPLAGAPADPFRAAVLQTAEIVRRAAVLRRRPQGAMSRPVIFPYRDAGSPRPMTFHVDRLPCDARLILGRGGRHMGAQEQTAVAWSPTPLEIAQARAEWSVWHAGLVTLRAALAGRLERCEPTGPAVPAEPWRDGLGAARRVLPVAARIAVIPPKTRRANGRR